MKVHKKSLPYGLRPWHGWQACWQCILSQINKKPSPNQSKTDIYVFSAIIHPPSPLLKSSLKITFEGQTVIFYYRKHPNTSLHLFVIDFTILDRLRTFRIFFSTRFILYAFCHIFIHNYEIKRNCGEKEMFLSYYLPWCLTSI